MLKTSKLYLTQEFIDIFNNEDNIYYVLKLIHQYAAEYSFYYDKPRKVISKQREEEVVGERGDSVIKKIIVTTVVEESVKGNYYEVRFNDIPKSMSKVAAELGNRISRQSLGREPIRSTIENFRSEKKFGYNFSSSFFALNAVQLEYLVSCLDCLAAQRRAVAAKIWLYMIINCNKYKRFNHNYDSISKETGICKDTVIKMVKTAIDNNIIELLHKGNNLNGLANSYGVADFFINLV